MRLHSALYRSDLGLEYRKAIRECEDWIAYQEVCLYITNLHLGRLEKQVNELENQNSKYMKYPKHPLLQFFKWDHLPVEKQRFSKPFGELAESIWDSIQQLNPYYFSVEKFVNSLALPDNLETRMVIEKLRNASGLLGELEGDTRWIELQSGDIVAYTRGLKGVEEFELEFARQVGGVLKMGFAGDEGNMLWSFTEACVWLRKRADNIDKIVRLLLEAKDCAVRASFYNEDYQ